VWAYYEHAKWNWKEADALAEEIGILGPEEKPEARETVFAFFTGLAFVSLIVHLAVLVWVWYCCPAGDAQRWAAKIKDGDMTLDLLVMIGLVGGSFTLFTAIMELRSQIDDRRNFALGLAKDAQDLPNDMRLYILYKDVRERWIAMLAIITTTGVAFTGAVIYGCVWLRSIDFYLDLLMLMFGLGCLLGGGYIWKVGSQDLQDARTYIVHGKIGEMLPLSWRSSLVGDEAVASQAAAQQPVASEP
jgi:hypothetical protein